MTQELYGGDVEMYDQRTRSSPEHNRRVIADFDRSYSVLILEDFFETGRSRIAQRVSSRSGLIVTTPTVADLYLDRFRSSWEADGCDFPVLVLDCDETSKTIDQVLAICKKAIQLKIDRAGVLIGFGGGVCTDLVTVAASWIRRGIGHVRVPTTLVGQVDAAIGIKGALNFQGRKSYLGCFYPPELVVVAPQFLASVPLAHLRSGLAEILKISILRDQRLFGIIESHADELVRSGFRSPHSIAGEAVWLSIQRMIEELEENIYENRSYKRLVDFGHTFSPALESASRFRIAHGNAVAVDMALSCVISLELKYIQERAAARILNAICSAGLPLFSSLLTQDLCQDALDQTVRHRGGMLNLVVPTSVGDATFITHREHVESALVDRSIARLKNFARDVLTRRPSKGLRLSAT